MIGEYFYKKSNLLKCVLDTDTLHPILYRLRDGKDDGNGFVVYTLEYINPENINEIKSVSVSKHLLKERYFSCDDYDSIIDYLNNNVSDITRRCFNLLKSIYDQFN